MAALAYQQLFSLLAVHFIFSGVDAVNCPPSWLAFQQYCYGVAAVERTWMDAEVECQALGHGGHLASLLSEPEHAAVANYIKNSFPTVERLWIGLNDPRKSRNWAWSDWSPFFYQAWNVGEPNNHGGKEFCVHIMKETAFKKWNDANCKLTMPSLCKAKV